MSKNDNDCAASLRDLAQVKSLKMFQILRPDTTVSGVSPKGKRLFPYNSL